jgi:hypothetical protein
MMRRAPWPAALAFALVACGVDGKAADVDYTSARSIATALHDGGFACMEFELEAQTLFAREQGSCKHGETIVIVTTYNSVEQQEQINEASGILASGVAVIGDRWQVNVNDQTQAELVQDIVGGQVR